MPASRARVAIARWHACCPAPLGEGGGGGRKMVDVQVRKVEDNSRAEGHLVWAERVKNIVPVTAMAWAFPPASLGAHAGSRQNSACAGAVHTSVDAALSHQQLCQFLASVCVCV